MSYPCHCQPLPISLLCLLLSQVFPPSDANQLPSSPNHPHLSSLANLAVQLPVGGSSQVEDMDFSQLGRFFHITQITEVDPGDKVMASTPTVLPPHPMAILWRRSSALVLPNDQDFYPELTQSPEESKLALVVSQRNFYEE